MALGFLNWFKTLWRKLFKRKDNKNNFFTEQVKNACDNPNKKKYNKDEFNNYTYTKEKPKDKILC